MKDFLIDLQLFAEGGGEPAADNQPAQDTPLDGEPTPNTPENPAGSILGDAGKEQTNRSAENNQPPVGAPDAYDFSSIVPDGMEYDQQAAEDFGNICRECGLTQEQASKMAAYGMQFAQGGVNAAMQQLVQQKISWGEDAKKQLGAGFDKAVSQAAVGINKLSEKIPGFRQMLNETGAGNRIEMIQFMAAVGNLFGEDGGHGTPGYDGQKTIYPNTNFGQYK